MLWFLRGLRRGVVTTRYPAEIDPWARALPSAPAFHSALLTRRLADELEAACPAGAIRRDGDVLVVDLGGCTACGRCAQVAGEAVAPSGQFLLAATEREALLKRVPIGEAQHD
jgi:NAD-dependent dihydropyrimidine dehydrogenase PreA subunit